MRAVATALDLSCAVCHAVGVDDKERRRALGNAVVARRKQLGLDQKEVHDLGGPSIATIRKIEGAKPGRPQLGTTWPLERVLGWRPGAINAFLEGITDELPEAALEPDYSTLKGQSERDPRSLTNTQLITELHGLAAELGRRLAYLQEENTHATQVPQPQQDPRGQEASRPTSGTGNGGALRTRGAIPDDSHASRRSEPDEGTSSSSGAPG